MKSVHPWFGPAVWALFIFILSSQPDVPGAKLFLWSDKIGHVLLYMPLGFLLVRAMILKPGPFRKSVVLWAVVLGSLYAVTDEVHQMFVPGRTAELADLMADMIGVFIGVQFYRIKRNDGTRR